VNEPVLPEQGLSAAEAADWLLAAGTLYLVFGELLPARFV
jgi:hypothetical protein